MIGGEIRSESFQAAKLTILQRGGETGLGLQPADERLSQRRPWSRTLPPPHHVRRRAPDRCRPRQSSWKSNRITGAFRALDDPATGQAWPQAGGGSGQAAWQASIASELERKAQRQLRKGIGILKVAKPVGLGTGTVHRIKREMDAG
jgi:hypothetical protein